jgi:hypothetical protein
MILQRSGYLTQDDRRGTGYWRLRFRSGRKTRTVYLGRNEQLVAEVRRELARLQQERRLCQSLEKTAQQARHLLQDSKQRLKPVLRALGLHYHGEILRRFRQSRVTTSPSETIQRRDA